MTFCTHEDMTMVHVQGPVSFEYVQRIEYVHFSCKNCDLNCYRKREHGIFYNGNWEAWYPTDDYEAIVKSSAIVNGRDFNICSHPNLVKNPVTTLLPVIGKNQEQQHVESKNKNNENGNAEVISVSIPPSQESKKRWCITEIVHVACTDCRMNIAVEREKGILFDGPWTKIKL